MINKDSPIPYYLQLADILRDRIISGQINSNDLIPSERKLCNAFDVSRSTVRQCIQVLKEEGLIHKEKGIGTRVHRNSKLEQDLVGFYNFDMQMQESGHAASLVLLESEALDGPGSVLRLMGLPANTRIFKVVRLRIIDEEPVFLEKIYMSLDRFPRLKAQDFLATDVFVKKVTHEYNTKLGDAKVFIEPILLDKNERQILGIDRDPSPGLMLERISYDHQGVAVAVTKRVFRGDRCRHMLTIKQQSFFATSDRGRMT